tara:strand:+ start:1093 stop:1458 length:366 start_codon:yes stop_codon:yes gene_type:complete
MRKEFRINKGEREIFRAYVELIRPFLKGLRPREADVFAEILYRYYQKRDISNVRDRIALVLNSNSREEIAEQLNMSQAILRNAISSLRKKEILKEGNMIPKVYQLDLSDQELDLSFIFKVS